MSRTIAISALFLFALINGANVASATDEIALVVAALNERAIPPGPDGPAEDGSLDGEFFPAAWTVGTPVDHGGCSINVAVLGAATAVQVNDVVLNLMGDPRIASATGSRDHDRDPDSGGNAGIRCGDGVHQLDTS